MVLYAYEDGLEEAVGCSCEVEGELGDPSGGKGDGEGRKRDNISWEDDGPMGERRE